MKTKLVIISIGLALLMVVYVQTTNGLIAETDSTKANKGETKMTDSTDKSNTIPTPENTVGDTVETESGLSYVVTKPGQGPHVKSNQSVTVHFVGQLAMSGDEFYNSYKESGPLEFALGKGAVIKGCDEGITGMAVGETRRLFIPYELGYGERGYPAAKIPPKSDLIFDVELVAIKPDKK